MRTIFATITVLALASPAAAYCYQVPDTAQTGYVENNLKRTICIQDELADSTVERSVRSDFDATVGKLQRDALQQRLQLQQLQTQQMLLQNQLLKNQPKY